MPGVQPPGCLCRPRSCSKASPCETSTVGATFWSWMLTSTFRQGPSAAPAGPVASCLLQVVHLCTDGMSCWQDSSVPKAHWAAACRQDSQLPQPAQVPQCRVPQVLAWTRPLSTSPYVSDACSSYQRRAGMGALRPGELQAPVHFAVQASGSARCQHCAGVWVGGGGGGGGLGGLCATGHQLTGGQHHAGVGTVPQPAAGNSLRRLVRSLSGRRSGPASPTSPAAIVDAQPGSFIEPKEHASSRQPKELAVSLLPQCVCFCISFLHLMAAASHGSQLAGSSCCSQSGPGIFV